MLTYVTLFKWTGEGAKAARESVDRGERNTELAQKMGGKILANYWTQGKYDVVVISEWPDEDTAQAFFLQMASSGMLRSQTLRAFSAEDMRRFVAKLS